MLSSRRRGEAFLLRLHKMFRHADARVIDALARYLTGADGDASAVVDAFIGRHLNVEGERPKRRPPRLDPKGQHHDLEAMRERLNRDYFKGCLTARIGWGRATAVRRRRSIQLGAYDQETHTIRLHPALDQAFVPAYFVEWVVYHEMLHELLGIDQARPGSSRRQIHTPEFEAMELRYAQRREAVQWERQNVGKLLRFKPQG